MAKLPKITYKGTEYDVYDDKALHQDDIGPWMPDFDNMPVLETHEFDISGTSIYKVCERANVTSINDATDVIAYRCTVTGTNIRSVTDVIFRLTPTVNTAPNVTAYNRTLSTTAATTGLRYIYTVYPKAANTNYTYQSCVAMYNSTTRHVKIEVFKTNSNWAFVNARTSYSYNSTYQTRNELSIYTRLGYISNSTAYFNANTANSATYISSYAPLYNSSYSLLTAGAALSANTIAFVSSEDNKVYPIGNTTKAINTNWPLMWVSNAVSSGGAISYSYLRIFGTITPGSTVTKDTFAAGQTVYCRCTLSNGNVYSNNLLTPTITPGYAYVKFGIAYSATVVVENAYGAFYFYKDMNGNVSNLNGYPIGAERANSVAKNINASAGSYGVLIDDHSISTLNSTVVPSISNNLTFNPSTGILNATGFSGSGAGLTNIPSSAVSGMPTSLSDLTDDMGVGTMVASDNVLFGTCSSAATDTTKVITISNSSYEIKAGTRILVWFYNVSDTPSSGTISISIDNVSYDVYIYRPVGDAATSVISLVAPYFKRKRFLNFYISGDNPQRAYIIPDTDVYLKSPYQKEGRPNSMNLETSSCAYVQHICATSACVTGKPVINGATRDSHVLHFNWDNSAAYSAQLAIQNGSGTVQGGMAYRRQTGVTNGWYGWKTLVDEDNIASYLPSTVEQNTNKVTSVSSSSTDTEYPSAKCVYDAISGISPGGGAGEGYYVGTCSTGASTATKVVTISDTSFSLRNGVRISVEMATANTNHSPKLNVNDTGAKPILISHIAKNDVTEITGAATLMPFSQAGVFDFRYYAAYNNNSGGWILDYTPQAFALGGRYVNGSRGSTLDLANVVEGGLRYGLWAGTATNAPFSAGVVAAISMFHDTAGAYTRQIAMSTGSFPKMAIRTQNNTAWGDWRYVLTAPTELSSTNNNLKPVSYQYSAALSIDSNVMTIPINGTKYRLTQLQLLNLDPDYSLGSTELYLFNVAGTLGYKLGTIAAVSAAGTASAITLTFNAMTTNFNGSTNVQTIAYYAEIE